MDGHCRGIIRKYSEWVSVWSECVWSECVWSECVWSECVEWVSVCGVSVGSDCSEWVCGVSVWSGVSEWVSDYCRQRQLVYSVSETRTISQDLRSKSEDGDSNFLVMFSSVNALRAMGKIEGMAHWCWPQFMMTHEICSTCSTYSPKSKRWNYSDIPGGGT